MQLQVRSLLPICLTPGDAKPKCHRILHGARSPESAVRGVAQKKGLSMVLGGAVSPQRTQHGARSIDTTPHQVQLLFTLAQVPSSVTLPVLPRGSVWRCSIASPASVFVAVFHRLPYVVLSGGVPSPPAASRAPHAVFHRVGMASSSKEGQAAVGARQVKCGNCGGLGHRAMTCPDPCFACGQEHSYLQCPTTKARKRAKENRATWLGGKVQRKDFRKEELAKRTSWERQDFDPVGEETPRKRARRLAQGAENAVLHRTKLSLLELLALDSVDLAKKMARCKFLDPPPRAVRNAARTPSRTRDRGISTGPALGHVARPDAPSCQGTSSVSSVCVCRCGNMLPSCGALRIISLRATPWRSQELPRGPFKIGETHWRTSLPRRSRSTKPRSYSPRKI